MASRRVTVGFAVTLDIDPVIVEPNLHQKIGEAKLVLRKCGVTGAEKKTRSDKDFLVFLMDLMKSNKIELGMSDEDCRMFRIRKAAMEALKEAKRKARGLKKQLDEVEQELAGLEENGASESESSSESNRPKKIVKP